MTRGKPTPEDGRGAPAKSAQAKAQDDQVMATNNSSIVSKRSVEKLYYPNEAHFFRYFVKKFQRRAPLINRGYHLRLHVIDVLVRNFLRAKDNGKQKVVVNLGCGSDVLPWQCLHRYAEECQGVKFVDVDFPDLIERKRQTVETTPELIGAFSGVKEKSEVVAPVVFESDQYVQVGCDLRQLETLRKGLDRVVDVANCSFVFVAEVSITYMETEGADGAIQWASGLGDAEFVLLEQIIPEGDKHPFAATMLSHFGKLNTQLKSVHRYPTLDHQLRRFSSRGWGSVTAWTLWQAWADQVFFDVADRRKLDEVEPFDEWEEFALFGAHYCLVHAKTAPGFVGVPGSRGLVDTSASKSPTQLTMRFDECPGQRGQRRFAAAMALGRGDGPVILNTLGLGTKSRLQSSDVFRQEASGSSEITFGDGGPSSRMCHSLTDLGEHGVLLAGGRGSPLSPNKDCWLFDKTASVWTKTHDLPAPSSRHSVVSLGASGLALLAGGKGVSEASGDFLLFNPQIGWTSCEVTGYMQPRAVYGAALAIKEEGEASATRFQGIFAGGLQHGLIVDQVIGWELDASDPQKPTIAFAVLNSPGGELIPRFGATCFWHGGKYVLVGGVIRDHLLKEEDEILGFTPSTTGVEVHRFGRNPEDGASIPRPLFTGHSAIPLSAGRVVVVGGGATCFSMGTFWNKGVYTFGSASESRGWVHDKTIDIFPGERTLPLRENVKASDETTRSAPQVQPIPRVRAESSADFVKIVKNGCPVVIEGLDLGACVANWNYDYLTEKVGRDRKVVVHESTTQAMNFCTKNFHYVTTEFGTFTERIKQGGKMYLRALSEDKPSEKPALLADDFPLLSPDFLLPPQLSLVQDQLFSSVLRVSGPVNMWLHYDVMANVYCQIGGTKRMVLLPPSDVEHLSFAPGASSSSIDVFASLHLPELAHTRPQDATLTPGDALYIPPLWLHTAEANAQGSIAVNVFFKDLDGGHYAVGRDVYGNRDLAAYGKGRQDVARIANSFQKLPAEAREFYLLRLADELRRKARG
ncbi:hypothetical protein OQA88_12251 [Cercophora sp. LCS_1]